MIATMKIDRRRPGVRACAIVLAASMFTPCFAIAQQPSPPKPDEARKQEKDRSAKPADRTGKGEAAKTQTPPKGELKVIPLPSGQTPPGAPPPGPEPGRGVIPGSGQAGAPGANPQTGTPPGGAAVAPGLGGQNGIRFTTGGGQFGRNRGGIAPGATISMDYRGADINNVLRFFAMAAGWQIVPDPTLTGNVTIISPKQLTIDQAFEVLQASLQIRGFSGQFSKVGETTILKIVPLTSAFQSGSTIIRPDGRPLTSDELKNQVITQVIPIENVDARSLATELTPLISKGATLVGSSGTNALIVTDIASNVQRVSTLVELLDKAASNSKTKMFPLQHADANEVANVINGLFRQQFNRGRGGGGPQPQPGQPGFQPGQQPQIGPNGQPIQQGSADRGAVIAVPDTRTNAIFVVASDENMRRVGDLIAQLDDPDATALKTKFRRIQFADAAIVADVVNGVLSGSNPTRSGASNAGFQQRIFGGGGFFGGGGGFGQNQQSGQVQSTDPFAKVVAEQRTNSVIITATEEKMAKIDDLIDQLDVNVPTETTTFVVPLQNAHADDVAYILGQTFGTGTTGGNNFGGGFNIFGGGFGGQTNNRRNTGAQNRRLGNQNTGRGGGRAIKMGYEQGGPSEEDVVPGVMTPNGFVPDPNSPTRGQFGFFGGGQFGRQQQPTPLFGRGSTGQQRSLLQLRQNVGVYADPNTNQLVINTPPENMQAIRDLIKELDVVPRQVMIEVIIAEATLDATTKLGVQFDANGVGRFLGTDITHGGSSNFPLGTAGSTAQNIAAPIVGGNYFISAMSGKFRALVQALGQDSRVKILSTPKVFGSNNQNAVIEITTDIPYVTSAFNGGFTGGQSLQYDFLPVGVTLDVTPRITRDNIVTIEAHAEASEFLGFDILSSTVDANGRVTTQPAPRTSRRSTDTVVSVRDGEAIILGGLMRDSKTINVNKIPLLSDIPILGHLFRSTSSNTVKTELMIFLIPHVVEGDASRKAMLDEKSSNIRKAFPNLEKDQPSLRPSGATQPEAGKNPQGKREQIIPEKQGEQNPQRPDPARSPLDPNGPPPASEKN